jgi:hypothetical protein
VIDLIRKGYEHLEGFISKGLEYFDWLATERLDPSATTDLATVVRRIAENTPGLATSEVGFPDRFSPTAPAWFEVRKVTWRKWFISWWTMR